jgi:hypothetical protein
MNRASYQPGLSSERRVVERTGPVSQNDMDHLPEMWLAKANGSCRQSR